MTAEEVPLIDAQWAVVNGTYHDFAVRQELAAQLHHELGREPNDQEFLLAISRRRLADAKAKEDPGGARDALVAIARHLIVAGRLEEALDMLLRAFLLDEEAELAWRDGLLISRESSEALPGRLVGVVHAMALTTDDVLGRLRVLGVAPKVSRAAVADRLVELLARYASSEVPGYVGGLYFAEHVESVKQLKRDRDLVAVEQLLLRLIDATEAESREAHSAAVPWCYEQLAILRAQRRDWTGEVEVLERYASRHSAPGPMPPKLLARLQKAQEKREITE